MTAIADYQTCLERASQIRPGDFLDRIEPRDDLVGPRGGRYRYDGLNVGSRVERVAWVAADRTGRPVEHEVDSTDWRPERLIGFRIKTRARTFTLPGNLADLTSAVVRRSES